MQLQEMQQELHRVAWCVARKCRDDDDVSHQNVRQERTPPWVLRYQ